MMHARIWDGVFTRQINLRAVFLLKKMILAYRNQYIIEDKFQRLKNNPTSLSPMFLKRDVGLIFKEIIESSDRITDNIGDYSREEFESD